MERKPVLIAYATRYGSTQEIAEEVAEALSQKGLEAVVRNVMEVEDLSGYAGVILGCPLYMGKWLPEVSDFVRRYALELNSMPLAAFTSGYTLREKTDLSQRRAKTAIMSLHPFFRPEEVGLFAGRVSSEHISDADRDIIRMAGVKEGDFRDMREVRRWAESIIPLIRGKC